MGPRYKVYAAETGISYQYFFETRRRLVRPEGQGPGNDFSFLVIADLVWLGHVGPVRPHGRRPPVFLLLCSSRLGRV